MPSILIDAENLIADFVSTLSDEDADSFFPAMGWLCGKLSQGSIPLISGFDAFPLVTPDNLKVCCIMCICHENNINSSTQISSNFQAFCAAFGTTGTVPLFHMAHITPEATENALDNMLLTCRHRRVVATKEDLRLAYKTLDGGKDDLNDEVHLVALGNPHLSLSELKRLSEMITSDDRPKNSSVDVVATVGRHVYEEGKKHNYVQNLEAFGVKFINDTCWCMILDPPIIPYNQDAKIITNSAKYASYGPALTNRRLRFGSTLDCIESSRTGRVARNGAVTTWLRSFASFACRHM